MQGMAYVSTQMKGDRPSLDLSYVLVVYMRRP